MKKLLTLVAAAFMAVSVSAANKVLKITGTADNPGETYSRQCFINLKNLEKGKAYVVKFDVYTTAGTEFTIGTEAIDDKTEHMTEWNTSAVFNYTEELTLTNKKSEAVINFPGKTTVTCHSHCTAKPGMEIDHKGGNTKNCDPEILENYEYAATALLLNIGKLPKDAILYIDNVNVYDEEGNLLFSEDFENATVAAYDKTKTAYYLGWQGGANFEIADENATYISSVDLANLDFSKEDAKAIGGWGGNFKSEINKQDGVDVITFNKQLQPHEVQVDFENVYPRGAKIQLTMEAKGSVEGSIKAGLQNPNNYQGCGDFEDINLTTDYQTIIKTVTCSGDNAKRLLLNVGQYEGTISIKSVKIEALNVPQETVTISPSGYSTYAAYYPVDYSKLGLKAYTVQLNAEKTGIVMNEVEGVVPAGVAVLLKGKADTDYALTKAEGWQNVTSDLKMSDGTITSTDKTTVYGLATVDGQDGFYKASDGKKIPVKCAYLEVANSAASSVKCFSLGGHSGSTTGITSVKNEAAGNNAPMYNLAGQLVDKGYKGIVIKNGKKIVLK